MKRPMLRSVAAFALAVAHAWAASQTAATVLIVRVRPEVALTRAGRDDIGVRIRLADGAQALIWRGTSCDVPPPDAYVIRNSGRHVIAASEIPGPAARLICLRSSDGVLADSI
jgi:hypothetical protein